MTEDKVKAVSDGHNASAVNEPDMTSIAGADPMDDRTFSGLQAASLVGGAKMLFICDSDSKLPREC